MGKRITKEYQQRVGNVGCNNGAVDSGCPRYQLFLHRPGHRVELGLNPAEITLLAITFFVLLIDLSDERANILQGIVHLLLFCTFIVFIFD